MNHPLPTRTLPDGPNLDQLKHEANGLFDAFLAGDHDAVAEVNRYHCDFEAAKFAFHDAQLVLARAYGFESWAKLKAYVDGVTVTKLADAVRAGDFERVQEMLKISPELATMDMAEDNEHQALHYAVYGRNPAMVRLLMQHGADARKGVYPHRDATSALTIATEREYLEIVAIILEEEQHRADAAPKRDQGEWPSQLIHDWYRGDEPKVIAYLETHPELINYSYYLMTPLHGASAMLYEHVLAWLLEHGADVNARDGQGPSPLELVGRPNRSGKIPTPEKIARVAVALRKAGARMTPRAAVVLGEVDWLRAWNAAGKPLDGLPTHQGSGLIEVAVTHNQPEMLALLLELGFDPNYNSSGALRECARMRRVEMAETLLQHGATLTGPVAVALGKGGWLRSQHAAGTLENPFGEEGGLVSLAIRNDRADMLNLLLDLGFDPDERRRLGLEEVLKVAGGPLRYCASSGKLELATILLNRGADPNAWDYPGPPIWAALRERDEAMVALLEKHGAVVNPSSVGHLRDTERARLMFADDDAGRLRKEGFWEKGPLAVELLGAAASGGDPEIVRMALGRIDWPRDDPRWIGPLWEPLHFYNHIPWIVSPKWEFDRSTYLTCFRLILERCDPDLKAGRDGQTTLHEVAAMGDWITDDEVVQFATALLDTGARTDIRDNILKSTPLGWACRWGRVGMVNLLLARGADRIEADAEPWATPRAWADKKNRDQIKHYLASA